MHVARSTIVMLIALAAVHSLQLACAARDELVEMWRARQECLHAALINYFPWEKKKVSTSYLSILTSRSSL